MSERSPSPRRQKEVCSAVLLDREGEEVVDAPRAEKSLQNALL